MELPTSMVLYKWQEATCQRISVGTFSVAYGVIADMSTPGERDWCICFHSFLWVSVMNVSFIRQEQFCVYCIIA